MQNNRTGDTLCSQFPTFPGSLMGHRHSDLRKLANIYTFFAHSSTPRVLRNICKLLFLKDNKHSVSGSKIAKRIKPNQINIMILFYWVGISLKEMP